MTESQGWILIGLVLGILSWLVGTKLGEATGAWWAWRKK